MNARVKMWHSVPVPYTVSWTAEEPEQHPFFIETCPYSRRPAICQAVISGEGKPRFGKPHMQRQREAISLDLCDLCGRSMKVSTKVSLSHARPISHANRPGDILQVEPMLHKACAALSMLHCPSLKRDVAAGTVAIRQVLQHDVQFAIMDEEYTYLQTGKRIKAIGHAKVHLLKYKDRDLKWLEK